MADRLNLSINETIKKKAAQIAEKHNKSLSRIVEDYFIELIRAEEGDTDIAPEVKALAGVLKASHQGDWRKAKGEYLDEKYGPIS